MKIRLLIVLGILLPFSERALAETLGVEPLSGVAPLEVTITGPERVLEQIAKCRFGFAPWIGPGANGLSIDWGDGSDIFSSQTEGSCAEAQRKHVYPVPGTYRLGVKAWHPGPNDAPVTDWSGEAAINVTGQGPTDSLELIEPNETKSYRYQELTFIRWNASSKNPSTIRVEFFGEDGTSLGAPRVFEWATVGERSFHAFPYSSPLYDAALRRGQDAFFVRVSLTREGKVLIFRDSLLQGMSAQYPESMQPLELTKVTGAGPYTASFRLHSFNPDCYSYRVEWGDGQESESIRPVPHECMGNSKYLALTHIYAKAGGYRVVVRTNELYLGHALQDVLPYHALDIDVGVSAPSAE